MYLCSNYIKLLGLPFVTQSNIFKFGYLFKNVVAVRGIFTSCVPVCLPAKLQYDPPCMSNLNFSKYYASDLVVPNDNSLEEKNKVVIYNARTLISVPELNLNHTGDLYEDDDFLLTQEFKNVLSSSLFHYDVSVINYKPVEGQFLSPSFVSFSPYQPVVIYLDHLPPTISTDVLLCDNQESKKTDESLNQTGKPTEDMLIAITNYLCESLLSFFEKPQDYSMYHRNVVFHNNFNRTVTKGISDYKKQMYMLKLYGHLCFAKVKVEILKITHHLDDGTVRVRWRVNGVSRAKIISQIWKLKLSTWKDFLNEESEWIDGFSVFSVDKDGLIYKHFCDKMIPDGEGKIAASGSIRTRILSLLGIPGRPSTIGGIQTMLTYSNSQNVSNEKTVK